MKINNAVNTAAGLFAILVGALVYLFVGNVWVTVFAFIAALFLAKALRPFYQHLFDLKKEPPTTITVLRERGFESGEPEERIFYVLLITQDIMLDVDDPEQKALLEDIFEKSVVALNEKYDFFRSRYATVQEREMPMKICIGTCGVKAKSLGKCYRDWQKHVYVDNRTIPPKENIDVFFHDQKFTGPDGIEHNAVTAVQFYRW